MKMPQDNKIQPEKEDTGRGRLFVPFIAGLGLMLALAVILGYVEAILPFSVGIPGIKLGLANCAILFILYRYGFKEALLISVLRTVIIAFLFTDLAALLYSISGAVVSLIMMRLLLGSGRKIHKNDPAGTKGGFSIYGISAAGGVSHNVAQMTAAFFILGTSQVLGTWLTLYLPILLISGLVAGLFNALIADLLLGRIKTAAQAVDRNP